MGFVVAWSSDQSEDNDRGRRIHRTQMGSGLSHEPNDEDLALSGAESCGGGMRRTAGAWVASP